MKLKILLFPLSVVVALWISIGHIKPMISQSISLRDQLAKHEEEKALIEQRVSKSNQLASLLEQNSDLKQATMHYLPDIKEGETLVDSLNYLGNQVGVVVLGMNFTETQASAPIVIAPVAPPPSAEVLSIGNSGVVERPVEPVQPLAPHVLTVEANGNGSYQSIKNFLYRLSHTNRHVVFKGITIEHLQPVAGAPGAQAGAVDLRTDSLKAKITLDAIHFPLLADVRNASINPDVDVFAANESFDDNFETVRKMNSYVAAASAQVPTVTVSGAGKGNPFVQ